MELRKIIYPGRDVPLSDGSTAKVWPFSLAAFDRVQDGATKLVRETATLISTLAVAAKEGYSGPEVITTSCQQVARVLLGDMRPVLQGCCDVDVNSLATWDMESVLTGWLLENFGEEKKVAPFVAILRQMSLMTVKTKEGGIKPLIELTQEQWSSAASLAAIALRSYCEGRLASLTQAGAGSSSSIGTQSASNISQPSD
jgi:hypothetical protein